MASVHTPHILSAIASWNFYSGLMKVWWKLVHIYNHDLWSVQRVDNELCITVSSTVWDWTGYSFGTLLYSGGISSQIHYVNADAHCNFLSFHHPLWEMWKWTDGHCSCTSAARIMNTAKLGCMCSECIRKLNFYCVEFARHLLVVSFFSHVAFKPLTLSVISYCVMMFNPEADLASTIQFKQQYVSVPALYYRWRMLLMQIS